MAAENDRVEEARQSAGAAIEALKAQITACLEELTRIQQSNRPAYRTVGVGAFDYEQEESKKDSADALADEISASLQALVGTTEETEVPKAEPKHPVSDTTGKFANLRFGPNYDPTKK